MRTPSGRDSRYTNWLLALIGILLVALALFAVLIWQQSDLSCGQGGLSEATVTTPPSAPTTSTTSAPPSTSTTAAPTTTTEPAPVAPLAFDNDLAMNHLKVLAKDIGSRKSGTEAEERALDYAAAYLQDLGYEVHTTDVLLPGDKHSHNVYVTKQGHTDSVLVVGGHIDCSAKGPGGNDNASGSAVVLELARDFRDADTVATIQFVLFGAEEMTDSDPDHHHYGSRQFLQGLTSDERSALVGMISVDMVAYGTDFKVRTMKRGPQLLSDMVKAYSDANGLSTRFLRDTGTSGMSDHEPFELAGYPAVWVEWRADPDYHTARDTYEHCKPDLVRKTGEMLVGFLYELTQSDLDALAEARTL